LYLTTCSTVRDNRQGGGDSFVISTIPQPSRMFPTACMRGLHILKILASHPPCLGKSIANFFKRRWKRLQYKYNFKCMDTLVIMT
jgi:hypothetical protein